MPDATNLTTAEGLATLEAELAALEGEGRREIADRIKTAREWGDLKENSEYHDAKNEQAHLETKIARLREKIAAAVVVEEAPAVAGGVVGFGSTVVVRDQDDVEHTWRIVSSHDAAPAEGRLSVESPVALALLGRGPASGSRSRCPRASAALTILTRRLTLAPSAYSAASDADRRQTVPRDVHASATRLAHEPLRRAPIEALSLAQRLPAQALAASRDQLQQHLARLRAALAAVPTAAACAGPRRPRAIRAASSTRSCSSPSSSPPARRPGGPAGGCVVRVRCARLGARLRRALRPPGAARGPRGGRGLARSSISAA